MGIDWGIILAFMGASLALTLSPGPDNLYVFTVSVGKSKTAALQLSLGLTTGLFFHTAIVAFGWSEILMAIPEFVWAIKIGGAGYLAYLAVGVLQQHALEKTKLERERKRFFWQGLVMNLTNPKVTLFFMVFFPGFLFSDQLSLHWQFGILGLLFWAQALFVFGGISVLGHSIKKHINLKVTQNTQNIIQASILFSLSILLLLSI